MREKINEDPRVKAGIVIVLAIAGLFMFMTRVKGGAEEPAATTDAAIVAPTAPTAASAAVPSPTVPVAGTTAPATSSSAVPLIDDAPLPTELVSAYNSGELVVLLLVREDGIDDRLVEVATEYVAGVTGAALFVDDVSNVSRYTQITQAINLDRVPALVVLRPKRLTAGTATATVSYGFRDVQSVRQEIEDALFDGRTVGYSPD